MPGSTQQPTEQPGIFHDWYAPDAETVGKTALEFLHLLPGPTHIHIPGKDPTRCRAVATLLHGNEPSGLFAVHEVLRQKIRPLVDIHIFIPSVDAAKQAPGFIYRMLPQHRDLNRCFSPPFDQSEESRIAQTLLARLHDLQPECLLDIHNTSGSSPSFGVTTFMDARHDALVSLFTHRMIVTDLKLGALMEISETMMPTVTIECGGAGDSESNLTATEGLIRYLTLDDVLSAEHGDMELEFFHHPKRLELQDGSDIAYGDHRLMEDGVTLLPDIEHYNFGFVGPENQLGFVSGELSHNLRCEGPDGSDALQDYFSLQEGKLYPRRRLKLFMVTTNPEIARKDCLCYVVEADD